MNLRNILWPVVLVALLPVIALILWIAFAIVHGTALRLLGYEVDVDPKTLAHEIYKSGDSVQRCRNLRQAVPTMGPSLEDKIMRCVFEYASIAKDPLACEGLMPSSYGWSCLSGAQATPDACSVDYEKEVSWIVNGSPLEWKTVSKEGCSANPTSDERQDSCCYILDLSSNPNINDCSRFEGKTDFMNLCLSQLAVKTGNESLCSDITDSNKKDICIVQARYVGK